MANPDRDPRTHPGGDGEEPIEELVEESREENPDEITRREAYELELMEEDRSEEGAQVEVDEEE